MSARDDYPAMARWNATDQTPIATEMRHALNEIDRLRAGLNPPLAVTLHVYGEPYVGVIQGGTGPEMVTFDDGGEIIPHHHN